MNMRWITIMSASLTAAVAGCGGADEAKALSAQSTLSAQQREEVQALKTRAEALNKQVMSQHNAKVAAERAQGGATR